MVNDKMVIDFMNKKEYMIPVSEVLDLRAMSAMMDGPLFGPASMPKGPFTAPVRRKTEVF